MVAVVAVMAVKLAMLTMLAMAAKGAKAVITMAVAWRVLETRALGMKRWARRETRVTGGWR